VRLAGSFIEIDPINVIDKYIIGFVAPFSNHGILAFIKQDTTAVILLYAFCLSFQIEQIIESTWNL